MGKEIKAVNPKATAIYRFVGKNIYLKTNNLQYAAQLIRQVESKGGNVYKGRNWLRINMFGKHTEAKLGKYFIDLINDSDEKIEEEICDFYKETLERAQFKCEVKEI